MCVQTKANAPLLQGLGVCEGEPVPVHLEVRGAVAGHEEELQARGSQEAGGEQGEGGARHAVGRVVCGCVW